MSNTDKTEKAPKKGLLKRMIVPLIAVAVLGCGGAVAGFYVAGSMNAAEEAEDLPQVMLKDGTKVSAREAGLSAKGPIDGAAKNLKVSYYQIKRPFTSNLRASSSFVQLQIAVSTYYDESVILALEEHDVAIRSEVLMALAETDPITLDSHAGKKQLKEQIKGIVNQTLEDKTGFGGIDDVYFTSLVIQ